MHHIPAAAAATCHGYDAVFTSTDHTQLQVLDKRNVPLHGPKEGRCQQVQIYACPHLQWHVAKMPRAAILMHARCGLECICAPIMHGRIICTQCMNDTHVEHSLMTGNPL